MKHINQGTLFDKKETEKLKRDVRKMMTQSIINSLVGRDVRKVKQFIFKIIAVGDGTAGKTSIIRRYVHEEFDSKYIKTIGVSHALKRLCLNDAEITMTIWDTGGQELFDCIRPQYYRGAHGVLIVYDVTSQESFDHLDKWIAELDFNCGNVPKIIVGNKIDLTGERVILPEAGEKYARQNFVSHSETSAKTGENIAEVMEELAKLIISRNNKFRAARAKK